MPAQLVRRPEGNAGLPVLVWRLGGPCLSASTAAVGGGLGAREWVVNAQVHHDYRRLDIQDHLGQLAESLGLLGAGVGMLTAASVTEHASCSEGGVVVDATVGLIHPTWAAGHEKPERHDARAGTINIVASLPVRLEDGALLNAMTTATEAKAQALAKAGYQATGTPSDAVTVLCALEGDPERFGGPRSEWGAPLARVVYRAVLAGARREDR